VSRRGIVFGWAVLLACGIALGYAGWRMRTTASTEICDACNRHVHPEARTVGTVDGKREVFCCPTCALTDHLQTGKAVTITSLTDAATGNSLAPADAYLVEGSDVNYCMRQRPLIDPDKRAAPMEFDRCSPSIIAFAGKEAAMQFAAEHGGRILRFEELAAAYQK
jgi:hypothetical protein